MGTRADFYVGRGPEAEWLGSIAWDGDPEGSPKPILAVTKEAGYREVVGGVLTEDDATLPEQGWPWPWNDSRTTDYAYAFDGGKVWASCYGHEWFDPLQPEPDHQRRTAIFPDMSARKNITHGPRSGLITFSMPGGVE